MIPLNKLNENFFLISMHGHYPSKQFLGEVQCPSNLSIIYMNPIGFTGLEDIPQCYKNFYTSLPTIKRFVENPSKFILENKTWFKYCSIIPPGENYLDYFVTNKKINDLGIYNLPKKSNSKSLLKNMKAKKFNLTNNIKLSEIINGNIKEPNSKKYTLKSKGGIIFIDSCRAIYNTEKGKSFQNEYSSLTGTTLKFRANVEEKTGRFFTLNNENYNEQLNAMNEYEKNQIKLIINKTKSFKKKENNISLTYLQNYLNNETNKIKLKNHLIPKIASSVNRNKTNQYFNNCKSDQILYELLNEIRNENIKKTAAQKIQKQIKEYLKTKRFYSLNNNLETYFAQLKLNNN